MNDHIAMLRSMANARLGLQPTLPTAEQIREVLTRLRTSDVLPVPVTDNEAEELARELEVNFGILMPIGSVLTERDYEPWLEGARGSFEPDYWNRYRHYLSNDRNLPPPVISSTDTTTERVLGLLENPTKEGEWVRKGLVVGHVQSGKTAHYTGLINKAADAGYKVLVIIAGTHNNLRNQTQGRIDEGFIGRDSARLLSKREDLFIGVGNYNKSKRPVTLTNTVRDFNKTMATGAGIPIQNLTEPAVFVIKKNTNTLKNLTEWLKEHSTETSSDLIDVPMLLIDDEADNASINTKYGKGDISRINGQIRELLAVFKRRCYVGYTATPFANIFIDPDTDDEMLREDLFPRDFIVSLDPPSNYLGPTKVFLDAPETFIRPIDDNEDYIPIKHRMDLEVDVLPDSLCRAIRLFIIARAIRLARGHFGEYSSQHSSMLVNVSTLLNVQHRVRNSIHRELMDLQRSARINGALPDKDALKDPHILGLRQSFEEEYPESNCDWATVKSFLHEAASPINVIEVNGNSPGSLNYLDHARYGLHVIAVGGFSLSRGITLEGLTVSYFLRNSMMYDTLMQMGRWFGYRPGYEDLCRIYMPETAQGWYEHISDSVEELRSELRAMEAANATPSEFGLKVRSHPTTLIVTARNKMGSGEPIAVSVGLAERLVETAKLRRDKISIDNNRSAARRMVDLLFQPGLPIPESEETGRGRLFKGAPVDPILSFIRSFRNHEESLLSNGETVSRYIEERKTEELSCWDIFFPSIQENSSGSLVDESLGFRINCQRRTAGSHSTSDKIEVTNKQRVADAQQESLGISQEDIEEAQAKYRKRREEQGDMLPGSGSINYPGSIYRGVRKRPLLMVHMLQINSRPKDAEMVHPDPIVAWSISFPQTQVEQTRIEYIATSDLLRQYRFEDDRQPGDEYGDEE